MRDQTRPNTFLDQNLDHCRAHGLAYLIYIRIQLTLCLFILKLLFIETYLTRFISELVPKSQSTTPGQFIKMTPTTSSQGKMDSSNCLTNLFQWSLDNTFSWNHPWKRDSYYFNQSKSLHSKSLKNRSLKNRSLKILYNPQFTMHLFRWMVPVERQRLRRVSFQMVENLRYQDRGSGLNLFDFPPS